MQGGCTDEKESVMECVGMGVVDRGVFSWNDHPVTETRGLSQPAVDLFAQCICISQSPTGVCVCVCIHVSPRRIKDPGAVSSSSDRHFHQTVASRNQPGRHLKTEHNYCHERTSHTPGT